MNTVPLVRYTVLESFRDRTYLGFLVVMAFVTAVFILLGSAPWGLQNLVVERLGWMMIDVLLSFQTAIYAVNNLYRERDRNILYTHLTMPITRFEYLLGKAVGLFSVTVFLAMLGAVILLLGDRFLAQLEYFRWPILWLVFSVALKNAILLAAALFFSQLATSSLTASLFTLGVYIIGNGADEILRLASNRSPFIQHLLEFVYYLVPNLKIVDLEQTALYGPHVGIERVFTCLVYAFSYIIIGFVLAWLLFKRKNL